MKEIVITRNEAGQRFDKFLRKYLKNMPLSAIYKAIRTKEIIVNGSKSSEKYILSDGDIVKFNIEIEDVKKQKELSFIEIDYDFKTDYEDENIIIVEKKAGLLVHPDEGKEVTLTDQVMSYLYDSGKYNPEDEKTFSPSPCNRLDRNTEGLVMFAKNYDTLKAVNETIRNGGISKYYTALIKGKIVNDTYIAYIIKDEKTNRVKVYKERVKDSKEIITKVINIDTIGQYSLIDIDLITGRSHQIRAHLAWLGNPIVGDPKYGEKKMNNYFKDRYGLTNQYLIAYKLVFKNCAGTINYLEGKTVTMALSPVLKKIKNDVLKF